MSEATIHTGDCLEVLPSLPDDSVDLIVTDPPYFRVKSLPWDRQWATPPAFLAWLDRVLEQFARVLRGNGSLYVFASPKMAARVEVLVGERFNLLNQVVWRKHNGSGTGTAEGACKPVFRAYFPQTERVIFAEHHNADNRAKGEAGYGAKCDELRGFVFEPLRAYLDGERRRAGLRKPQVDAAWCAFKAVAQTAQSQKWFSSSCWNLPTLEAYAWMRDLFNASCNGDGPQYLRREYEDLRQEYEDLRQEYEALRRPFAVTADVPYTDVWDFPTVQARPGKHPCEKPLAMMRHIVTASSRPGAVVLDAFCGSGVVGEACRELGRDFIGIEADPKWAKKACERVHEPLLFAESTG